MKKLKYIIILLIVLLIPANYKASTNTLDRNTLKNYGVNKNWKITDNNKSNVLNTYDVNSDEKIYDFSDILTDEEEKELYEKFSTLINKTNMDIVFVSENLPYTNDKQNEDFASDFYDYNDFGINFENYSGIIVFRNTYEEDPYYGIYSFGNTQLYINEYRNEQILDDIYDSFHNGYYKDGLNIFLNDFEKYYDSGIPNDMKNYTVTKDGYLKKVYKTPILLIIIIDTVITSIILLVLVKKNKMVKKNLTIRDYIDNSGIKITKSSDRLIHTHVSSHTRDTSSGSSGGGSHSSHSGSSGGGHSGGGRHG